MWRPPAYLISLLALSCASSSLDVERMREELRSEGASTAPTRPVGWQAPSVAEFRPGPRTDHAPTLRQRLRTTMVPGWVLEEEESLRVAVRSLANITGLPMVVDQRAENLALDQGALFDLNLTQPLRAQSALNLLLDGLGDEVRWTIAHDVVLITTREHARARPVVRLHDVRMLTMTRTDFIAPRLDRIRLLDDLEDEDGGGPFGGVSEQTRAMELEDLATLVQDNVAVGTWDDEGVSLDVGEGFLIVVHSPEVQRQVSGFLDQLGQ